MGAVAVATGQPWPLLVLGVGFLCWQARRDLGARLAVLALVLFLPFALWGANRSLAYRDLLPMLSLAYIGAGGLAAVCLRWAAERAGPLIVGAAAVGFAVFAFAQTQ